MKLLHISYNLIAGTEMLSLSVYEPIAIQILLREGGRTGPQFGRGVELGPCVVPHETPPYLLQFVCLNRNGIFHRLRANRNTNFAWGASPNLAEGSS